jgi:hypothetical protein
MKTYEDYEVQVRYAIRPVWAIDIILGDIFMEQKRFSAMVRWSGVYVQGAYYYSKEMSGYIGHKVEVRMGPVWSVHQEPYGGLVKDQ